MPPDKGTGSIFYFEVPLVPVDDAKLVFDIDGSSIKMLSEEMMEQMASVVEEEVEAKAESDMPLTAAQKLAKIKEVGRACVGLIWHTW